MPNIRLAHANILTAFHPQTVGTKVLDPHGLTSLILDAITTYDFDAQRIPGQGFLMLPDVAKEMVSAGVGPRSNNPDHYVTRFWRDRVGCYLRREYAAPVGGCAAIVYSRDAYASDPDVQADPAEMVKMTWPGCPTHVLVAVLAFAGPKPPLSTGRFVANLAGGNKESATWSADEIRAMAKDIIAYDDAWSVVAD